jgi:hypothetical protein
MIRRKRPKTAISSQATNNPHLFAVHEGGHSGAFNMEALFQPDILIQSQYQATYQRRFHHEPEKILMLALLEDAIVCFQDNLKSACKKKKSLFDDAESWILDDDTSYIFSFKNICDVLGFDAGYLRDGLMRWKEGALVAAPAKEHRKRLAS